MQTIKPVKILIFGLPGSGKTTLAKTLSKEINAIHLNADEMRNNVWTDLTFKYTDRIVMAQRMGALSTMLVNQGHSVIADFVCPTEETRMVFGKAFIIFVDRINQSKYQDTNQLFEKPLFYDVRIKERLTLEQEINIIKEKLWLIL
ncbi:adenylyl-sulfate kinase [bacterium]|nr:adenylyl-sulfate kinase [Candidatus Elulimicrobium humile]